MSKIRVLIADDSVIYRSQIRAALGGVANVEVVGAVSNGRIACDMLGQSAVDLLILDLEMPEMDGLQTLVEMKKRGLMATKVILFSSFTKRGAEITLEALQLGASDFVTKPGAPDGGPGAESASQPSDRIRSLIEPKLNALFGARCEATPPSVERPASATPQPGSGHAKIIWELFRPRVVVIGSSTGGPTVLETIFSQLQAPLTCPILIVQHMPPLFTASLAERIEKICGIPAREAHDGERLSTNQIYMAPGNFHMFLEGNEEEAVVRLNQDPQENFVRPAVDPLFKSAAKIFGSKCLGVILTGMGYDGKTGAEAVKRGGGAMVIQSKETSVVFGMPGAVFESGHYDRISSPDQIAALLREKVAPSNQTVSIASGGN